MSGNSYQFAGKADSTSAYRNFGGVGVAVDGGYKVRSKSFNIENVDISADLRFSFDGTNYSTLTAGQSFGDHDMVIDRYWVVSDDTCWFQVIAGLKTDWL